MMYALRFVGLFMEMWFCILTLLSCLTRRSFLQQRTNHEGFH